MKKWILVGTFFLAVSSLTGGAVYEPQRVGYHTSSRPFNWSYPQTYRYYYPQLNSSGSCYMTYVNGTFIYRCD